MADIKIDEETTWRRLVEIYGHTKDLYLLAEEMDPKHEALLAPLLQLRDTLDHIMRAKAAELGLIETDPGAQVEPRNLDKALGHAYRAFFDVADWLGVTLREKVIDELHDYSAACINAVLPEYYPVWRAQIEKTNVDIAAIRGNKDIGEKQGLIPDVAAYRERVDALVEIWQKVSVQRGALEDFHKREVEAASQRDTAESRNYARSARLAWVVAITTVILSLGGMIAWELHKSPEVPASAPLSDKK